METGFASDPHSESGYSCPKNSFGYTDYRQVHLVEAVFVEKRAIQLEEQDVPGSFDITHLCDIHRFLFRDIFPRAGELRVVNISKGNANFGPAMHLAGALKELFEKLASERLLIGLSASAFVQRAAFYLGEINAIYPFREGNGRAQREFIRQLALQAGHPLSWSVVGTGFTQQQMIDASILSHTRGDNSQLAAIIEAALFSTRERGPRQMIERILIVGTGLIGASVGLALQEAGFQGGIAGFDTSPAELADALKTGAIQTAGGSRAEAIELARAADVVVLAVPVLAILDWMHLLAPVLSPRQLLTDVGSTKREVAEAASRLFVQPDAAIFLPGHPMAGKESSGAALADAALFRDAMWLFTPLPHSPTHIEADWRSWVAKFGARTLDMDADHHDELCAWISHLPQMLSTALAALLEDTFGNDPARREEINDIGGRALRETTRLGASPYSMWRDVALSNTEPLAATLLALEQRLQHIRENLRTPELREEFLLANRFRNRYPHRTEQDTEVLD